MLEMSWAEILVVGIVLILVSRPQDLPGMLFSFGRTVSWCRGLAADFFSRLSSMIDEIPLQEMEQDRLNWRPFKLTASENEASLPASPFVQKTMDSESAIPSGSTPDDPDFGSGKPSSSSRLPVKKAARRKKVM